MSKSDYYVYVYIDPRNFEEFYYGKGTGMRKYAHLNDSSDTDKVRRIKQIEKEGLKPIIKVIANGLTSEEALLIEKTLIWKLGKNLTNISSGHFANKFRPHNTLHKELTGFDYQNDILIFNVGEGPNRNWDDCRKYGFLAAGQGTKWNQQLFRLNLGDIVIPYHKDQKNNGYAGIGKVLSEPTPINKFLINNKTLNHFDLVAPDMFKNSDNENSEYLVQIEWIHSVPREDVIWERKSGLYTTQHICASLRNQPTTIKYIEETFKIKLMDLIDQAPEFLKKAS